MRYKGKGPQAMAKATGQRPVSAIDRSIEKTKQQVKDGVPYVGLRFFYPAHECLSEWSKEELKAFGELSRKVSGMTWVEIEKTGGKPGNKTGLGYTLLDQATVRGKYPIPPSLEPLSKDFAFHEMRVTHKARVVGFRSKDVFFLIWLDRNHKGT